MAKCPGKQPQRLLSQSPICLTPSISQTLNRTIPVICYHFAFNFFGITSVALKP